MVKSMILGGDGVRYCEPPETRTPAPRVSASGFRYYNPTWGRWLGRDPIGEKGFELGREPSQTGEPGRRSRCRKPGDCRGSRLPSSQGGLQGAGLSQRRADKLRPPNRSRAQTAGLGQGTLAYAFALNGPLLRHDPLGLDCPGCDLVGGLPGMGTDCALKCCAQHDQCYHDNGCSAWSWLIILAKLAACAVLDIPPEVCLEIPVTPCDGCNVDVVDCLVGCAIGIDPGGPKYYCAQQGRYIVIGPGGDFPNLDAAKKCCCN